MATSFSTPPTRVTRGKGALEGLLARLRARRANALIPDHSRSGRLLDIGCGSFPHFLTTTPFAEKFGVDKLVDPRSFPADSHIVLLRHDVEADGALPFEPDSFDVVTMLAVFEHIPPATLGLLLSDVHRVLKPGGRLVLTTPAGWADPLLRLLARLSLVSSEEIDEHQDRYDHAAVRAALVAAGFPTQSVRTGSFELGLNIWATATRPPGAASLG